MRPWLCLLAVAALLSAAPLSADAASKGRGTTSAGASGAQKPSGSANRTFTRTKPPKAYAGQNPSQAARPQNRP